MSASRRLNLNLSLLMKLMHVLAAFWMVSGVVGRDLAFWWAGRAPNVQAVHALLRASDFFERYAVIPVSMAVLLFGLIVTWMQKWPLFGALQGAPRNWLLVSFILFVGISAFIAPLGLVARRKERTRAVEEAMTQGMITPALRAALNDQVVNRFRAVELVITVIIIILMVSKPF